MPGPPGTATTVGQVYTGSAFVAANTPGEQITSAYTARNTGDLIRYSLYASNFASTAQHFLADCLSLQTP